MNLRSDPRYTITREWAGHKTPQWVVRFCDEWVSSHNFKSSAMMRAVGEASIRRGALTFEAIEE